MNSLKFIVWERFKDKSCIICSAQCSCKPVTTQSPLIKVQREKAFKNCGWKGENCLFKHFFLPYRRQLSCLELLLLFCMQTCSIWTWLEIDLLFYTLPCDPKFLITMRRALKTWEKEKF